MACAFPALASVHPEPAEAIDKLRTDHAMIGALLGELTSALDTGAGRAEADRHLDGIGAIMESHFRYEERVLLPALERFALDADPATVFGPL